MKTIKRNERFHATTRYAVLWPLGGRAFSVVTQHRTLAGAKESLAREEREAADKGSRTPAYIVRVTR